MGVHLNVDDFKRVLSPDQPLSPQGYSWHYSVMPLAHGCWRCWFKMPPDLSAGMVLVGSVASGTASKRDLSGEGDVALSVTIFIGLHAGRRGRHTTTTRLQCRCPYSSRRDGYAAEHSTDCGHSTTLGLVIHHLLPRVVKVVNLISPAFSMVHFGNHQRGGRGFSFTYRLRRFAVIIAVILHNTLWPAWRLLRTSVRF